MRAKMQKRSIKVNDSYSSSLFGETFANALGDRLPEENMQMQ